jgi:sugar phosphate isomerase/epimerase
MSHQSIPRRSFLVSAAATVAGAVLTAANTRLANAELPRPETEDVNHPTAPVGASPIQLGIASYSLRNFTFGQALEMMKALRTPYVNFKDVHVANTSTPEQLQVFRQQVAAAGFQIVGGGTITFAKDTDDDVRRLFEYANNAGMPLIVGAGTPEVMTRVEKFAKQYDIKVAIHNHGPEDGAFPSPYDVLKRVKDMDARMGLCMDIGHTVRTGTDVVQAARDAGSRLLDMHAKDLRDLNVKESQCIVGEGAIPIPELFRALVAINYRGYVNLEYEIDASDPMPGMKQSFAYMRGVLAGMAS